MPSLRNLDEQCLKPYVTDEYNILSSCYPGHYRYSWNHRLFTWAIAASSNDRLRWAWIDPSDQFFLRRSMEYHVKGWDLKASTSAFKLDAYGCTSTWQLVRCIRSKQKEWTVDLFSLLVSLTYFFLFLSWKQNYQREEDRRQQRRIQSNRGMLLYFLPS